MSLDPIGFDQYNYDSLKYMLQIKNPGAKPLQPFIEGRQKKFSLDAPVKKEKAKKENKEKNKGNSDT